MSEKPVSALTRKSVSSSSAVSVCRSAASGFTLLTDVIRMLMLTMLSAFTRYCSVCRRASSAWKRCRPTKSRPHKNGGDHAKFSCAIAFREVPNHPELFYQEQRELEEQQRAVLMRRPLLIVICVMPMPSWAPLL